MRTDTVCVGERERECVLVSFFTVCLCISVALTHMPVSSLRGSLWCGCDTHTHIHTHTCTHTHTHTHSHTHTHTQQRTHTHKQRTHTHTCTHAHTQTHTHTHMNTHTHTHTCTHTYTHRTAPVDCIEEARLCKATITAITMASKG